MLYVLLLAMIIWNLRSFSLPQEMVNFYARAFNLMQYMDLVPSIHSPNDLYSVDFELVWIEGRIDSCDLVISRNSPILVYTALSFLSDMVQDRNTIII